MLLTTHRADQALELGLDYRALLEENPALVIVAVTAFGLDGPWAHYRSSDLIGLAAGGPLLSCGYDDHTIPPIRPGGDQGYLTGCQLRPHRHAAGPHRAPAHRAGAARRRVDARRDRRER